MRVFFNAIVVQVVLSAYVLWRGWNGFPKKKVVRLPFLAIFVIELVIYLLGFFFADKIGLPYLHHIAWIGTTWMVFILYMSALLLPYDLVRFINKKKRILPKNIDLARSKERVYYYVFSLVLVIGSMLWGNYRFNNPVITHQTIDIQKESKIDKLRIVMASDLHVGYLIRRDMAAKYVDQIMEQKPDMILLVGDIIDFDIYSVKQQHMEEEFKRLHAPYGVYAVTGNHEYIGLKGEEPFEKPRWLSEHADMIALRDSVVLVDSALYIVGREDNTFVHRKTLESLMDSVDTKLPVILMNHQPHDIHEADRNQIDLAFYGHTHNGQFFPNNIAVKFLYEKPYGYKKINDSHVYISSGLGLAGPQYRIGTVSEIVVFDVNFNK